MNALIDGVVAGLGISIPLGAIAILIVNKSMDKGFRFGFMAGAGTATVDLLFAAMAVIAGQAVVAMISPYAVELRVFSAIVLMAMGAYGLLKLRSIGAQRKQNLDKGHDPWWTYFQFIAITTLNPFTVVYFLALVMGKGTDWSFTLADSILFVLGVTIASLAWQTMLAGLGALAKRHLSPRSMQVSIIIGNTIVILLGVQILLL
jgi:arginine exporter protein ArgO